MLRRIRQAFTLIEVLVVVAIIALLVAILLPAMSSARSSARKSICASNLHQAGASLLVYAAQFKDFVPRGGNVQRYWSSGDTHWAIVLLKAIDPGVKNIFALANQAGTGSSTFNGKTYENRGIRLNALLWQEFKRFPVFQCPERAMADSNAEAISYIANAYEPAARMPGGPGFADVSAATKMSVWKTPSTVAYLSDLEKSSVSTTVANAYLVPGTGVGDLSYFDAFQLSDLPSASPGTRRIARGMHSQRMTSCLFMDGHVGLVDSLPRAGEVTTLAPYSTSLANAYVLRWLRLFGVKEP